MLEDVSETVDKSGKYLQSMCTLLRSMCTYNYINMYILFTYVGHFDIFALGSGLIGQIKRV